MTKNHIGVDFKSSDIFVYPLELNLCWDVRCTTVICTEHMCLKGIVHYFTMSILKECAVNGHHKGVIISF